MVRLLNAVILAAVASSVAAAARPWGTQQGTATASALKSVIDMPHGGDASELEAAKSAALQAASEKVS